MTLDLDGIEHLFTSVVSSDAWRGVEGAFADAVDVMIFGNGGNLSIAQHGAADLVRLTDKRVLAPPDSVAVTARANEFGFDDWLGVWLEDELRGRVAQASASTVAIGLSCSGRSRSVMRALEVAGEHGVLPVLLSGKEPAEPTSAQVVVLDATYYHSAETLMSLLIYQLAVSCGADPRRLG